MELDFSNLQVPELSPKRIEFEFTDYDFQLISAKIYKLCGIVLKIEKKSMVYARLNRRLRELKLTSFKSYLDYLSQNEELELVNLVNALTTNLTRFFRENHHFEHLATKVLPELIDEQKYSKDPRIRIWSAASSSGEEPYSIAMTLNNELQHKHVVPRNVKVLATDIDTQMIETGKNALYKNIEDVPPKFRDCFWHKDSSGYTVKDDIRKFVTFKQLNLLDPWPFQGPFDVVFCRNVVIYFDKETQRALFDRIADVLKPRGWLYIGHSESLFKVTDRFELIGQTIYQKVD